MAVVTTEVKVVEVKGVQGAMEVMTEVKVTLVMDHHNNSSNSNNRASLAWEGSRDIQVR